MMPLAIGWAHSFHSCCSASLSSSASMSVKASITPSHSIETASVCTTRRYPTTRPSCARSSPHSRLMADSCSSSTSLPHRRASSGRARAEGMLVAYLPGLAMRRIADLHAGEAKTDARDAAIIAEAVCSIPHTLRSLRLADEQFAELAMLCGFDDCLWRYPFCSASNADLSTQ